MDERRLPTVSVAEDVGAVSRLLGGRPVLDVFRIDSLTHSFIFGRERDGFLIYFFRKFYIFPFEMRRKEMPYREWEMTPASMLAEVSIRGEMKARLDYAFRETARQPVGENQGPLLFECICTFGTLKTNAVNTKKLNAKHAASENMLRLLEQRKLVRGLRVPPTPFLGDNEDVTDNPISKLHEFLQLRSIDRPTFDDDKRGALYHLTCTVPQLRLEALASSTSKKLAKREACKKMLDLCEACDVDALMADDNESTVVSEDRNKNYQLDRTNLHSFIGYRNKKGSYINLDVKDLHRLQGTSKFENILKSISERYALSVEYLEIKQRSTFGHRQVVARVNTIPIITCPAAGYTLDDARNAAALVAIEHINVGSRRMAYRERQHDKDEDI